MFDVVQAVSVFAPAKINLTLHVTGQRNDGYHLLDSVVAFADIGDNLTVHVSDDLTLSVDGAEAGAVPADMDNLVLRVARLFDGLEGARFLLTKELPVASGIGGGSADAAASYRALMTLLGPSNTSHKGALPELADLLALGADIPMCVDPVVARVGGIGEKIAPVAGFPVLNAVLVNPKRAVSTPSVFRALQHRDHPAMPRAIPAFVNAHQVAAWLQDQRNDLEETAMALEPAIGEARRALAQSEACLLARMSGSGATCFGLFPDRESAQAAAAHLSLAHVDWWVRAAFLGDQSTLARPHLIRSTT